MPILENKNNITLLESQFKIISMQAKNNNDRLQTLFKVIGTHTYSHRKTIERPCSSRDNNE